MLRLGTRGSPLALAQARMAASAIEAANGWAAGAVELVVVRTTGDAVQDRPLHEIGGKAVFTKELDAELLEGRIDCAVHSMKDVETALAPGVALGPMLPRAPVEDRLFGAERLADLRPGARLGTSSPRRAAQALALRPDLRVVALRGNVETRLARLAAGEVDATLLAAAGLMRLGQAGLGVALPLDQFLPAPAQGAVGLTLRDGDPTTAAALWPIDNAATSRAVAVERALLAALGGTCRTPIAALALSDGDGRTWLRAELLSPDGEERVTGARRAADADAGVAARDLAAELLANASPTLAGSFEGAAA
jgi:hydroxymethylbilane synthase